jgi:predicted methyltransferase
MGVISLHYTGMGRGLSGDVRVDTVFIRIETVIVRVNTVMDRGDIGVKK